MIRINLVAKKVTKEQLLIRKQTLATAVSLIVGIIISVMWVQSAFAKRNAVSKKLKIEKAEMVRLKDVKKKNEEFKFKKERRKNILSAIKTLQERRTGPHPFLDYLNVTLPTDIWLNKISEKDLAVTVSGFSFSSQAVAQLMRSMESSSHFSNVELSEVQRKIVKKEKIHAFTITAHWDLGIKKVEEEKKKKGKKVK